MTKLLLDIAPSRGQLECIDSAPDLVVALTIAACFVVTVAAVVFSELIDAREKKRRAEVRRNWEANQ